MKSKKEVQKTIVKASPEDPPTEEEFLLILRLIAPGTNMRTALNSSLKLGKGALIAVENENLSQVLDGGFRINARFTPQRFTESSTI